ncbi:cytochrome b5 domain-containing protein [Proteocatella sphenisci]|uniref:cytochrome b5 domain-containing protein n=1 Tax=Proteocatella sphenisci TaxID=181070 RepID=UPI0004B8F9ED|nr:cytochrome b5 domain-containing protein [Proteocatella sphenisci]
MKKTTLILSMIMLVLSLALFGCSSTDDTIPENDDGNVTTEEPAAPEQAEEKTFTLDELEEYDGKDGAKAYIAVDGVVYDVTDVKPWSGGEHNGYEAGKDLTEEIKNVSPHGVSKLEGITVVGKLG